MVVGTRRSFYGRRTSATDRQPIGEKMNGQSPIIRQTFIEHRQLTTIRRSIGNRSANVDHCLRQHVSTSREPRDMTV